MLSTIQLFWSTINYYRLVVTEEYATWFVNYGAWLFDNDYEGSQRLAYCYQTKRIPQWLYDDDANNYKVMRTWINNNNP